VRGKVCVSKRCSETPEYTSLQSELLNNACGLISIYKHNVVIAISTFGLILIFTQQMT